MMESIQVKLGQRSYPIYIGEGLLKQVNLLNRHIKDSKCAVITNSTVKDLYWKKLAQALVTPPLLITLDDGEQYKNLETLNTIFTQLLENFFDRSSILIALGGGVIGDMTGFAAACYQRGINFIQIPTTLLSQVDSSVGGKTAVNHSLGKNMIGAFHQPVAVISDTAALKTLPARELSAGLAEVIKYGLISDIDFLDWLENNMGTLLSLEDSAMTYAIKRSCEIKADIVARDETEQSVRALLNLGHTFGHAIETFTEYKSYLHGECVGIGMAMAAEFSQRLNFISQEDCERSKKIIRSANLPTTPPREMNKDIFIELMMRDKKTQKNAIRLVLMKNLGKAFVSADYDHQTFVDYLEQIHTR